MDILREGNRSGQSSPAPGNREKRPSSRSSAGPQNGRGSARGQRGGMNFRGRGYRGGGMPNQNFRGGPQGMRGGFQPGRPHANKKDALKFEKDYDFEEANQEFAEVLSKLQVGKIRMSGELMNSILYLIFLFWSIKVKCVFLCCRKPVSKTIQLKRMTM